MSVAIAFDGDEAGQRVMSELMLKMLDLSDSETQFVRSFCLDGHPFEQAVRSLDNWELADELSSWAKAKIAKGGPDWWYEMCEEYYSACLGEITRRSRKLNDLGGIDYIKTFNANNTITDILAQYGVNGVPGRNTTCPMHDDSTPSLSISKDNGRAYCFNQSCSLWGDGHGVDPFGLNKILKK